MTLSQVFINRRLPESVRRRYDALRAKREAGALAPEEYEEMLGLIDQVEDLQAERMEDLARLARLRGVTVEALMESLGIRPPGHG